MAQADDVDLREAVVTQALRDVSHVTNSIREIMSRGKPHRSTSPARAAHAAFVAAFAEQPPHPIYMECEADDLTARADHLEKALAAFHVYLTAVLTDTVQHTHGEGADLRYIGIIYSDLSDEVVGGLRNVAEKQRETETWRAS